MARKKKVNETQPETIRTPIQILREEVRAANQALAERVWKELLALCNVESALTIYARIYPFNWEERAHQHFAIVCDNLIDKVRTELEN